MKIYVISLLQSKDRKESMIKQLAPLNLDYQFFPAVNGYNKEHQKFEQAAPVLSETKTGRPMLDTETAVFASHYKLWQKAVALNESIIILEDDIVLTNQFEWAVKELIPKLTNQYSLIKFRSTFEKKHRARETLNEGFELVQYYNLPLGAQGYALTPGACKKLIANSNKWLWPVDNYIEMSFLHGVDCIELRPNLIANPEENQSTIENRRKRKKTLKNKIKRELYKISVSLQMLLYKIKQLF